MLKRNSRGLLGLISALMLCCIPLQGALAEPPKQEAYGAGSTRVEVIQDLGVRGSGPRYERGNVDEAAEYLVVGPAEYTFSRCLGCFDDRYFETSRDR